MIPPRSQAYLLLAKSSMLEWTATEMSHLVKMAECQIRGKIPKGARMKESLNHRDLYGLDTLTSSRFVYIFSQLFVYIFTYLFTKFIHPQIFDITTIHVNDPYERTRIGLDFGKTTFEFPPDFVQVDWT